MKNIILPVVSFFIVWFVLFFFIMVFGNSFDVVKRFVKFDFGKLNKIELWISLIASAVISAIIASMI